MGFNAVNRSHCREHDNVHLGTPTFIQATVCLSLFLKCTFILIQKMLWKNFP